MRRLPPSRGARGALPLVALAVVIAHSRSRAAVCEAFIAVASIWAVEADANGKKIRASLALSRLAIAVQIVLNLKPNHIKQVPRPNRKLAYGRHSWPFLLTWGVE